MSTQPTHRFLPLLPFEHPTWSASTVAPDTIPDTISDNLDASAAANDIEVLQKTRRSSSSTTTSSATSDKVVMPAEPIVAVKRTSTFLSN
jgi:hypothetical protein